MKPGNLYADIPSVLLEESLRDILNRGNVRIERIVSQGHCTPDEFWYDQDWDEWVLVLSGRAGLEIEGRPTPMELGPGDYLLIPSHIRHRVAWTDTRANTIWLAVHIHPQHWGKEETPCECPKWY
jgi:cupin 2 domain-containing protein